VTKQVDALGNVTTFAYDGNGNLVSKTDPDGYTTEYTYNALDLVTSINYNNAKEVSYRYNATGDLVSMTDWLGTTDYLTSAVNSKIISWTSYNEWGEITHNAVLKCGQRELDLVKLYATHDYDSVLDMYYAKARLYDADDRRFTAVDPILDPSRYDLSWYVTDPMQLVQYLYVGNNAVNWVDPLGLTAVVLSGSRLFTDVDTSDADSVVEMLNLYTNAKVSRWSIFGNRIKAYDYTSEKIITISNWENASVSSILEQTGMMEGYQNAGKAGYFTVIQCTYYLHAAPYGSSEYLSMVDSISDPWGGLKNSARIDRIMRDINNYSNVDTIDDSNFSSLGNYVSDLLLSRLKSAIIHNAVSGISKSIFSSDGLSGISESALVNILKYGLPTEEEHYFRNKLNVNYTYAEVLALEQAGTWERLPSEESALHQHSQNPVGVENSKWVSVDGHYELVFDGSADKVLQTAYNNPEDMGTYNYAGPNLKLEHTMLDVLPWIVYGNTTNDSTSMSDRATDSALGLVALASPELADYLRDMIED